MQLLLKSTRKMRLGPLKYILRFGGPIGLLGTLFLYFELTRLETKGGSFYSPSVFIWLYENFGKWGTVGAMLAVSFAWFVISIRHYRLKKAGKVQNGHNPDGWPNLWS